MDSGLSLDEARAAIYEEINTYLSDISSAYSTQLGYLEKTAELLEQQSSIQELIYGDKAFRKM